MSNQTYTNHNPRDASPLSVSQSQEEIQEELHPEDLPPHAIGNGNGHGSGNGSSDVIIRTPYEQDPSGWDAVESPASGGPANYGTPGTRDRGGLATADNARSLWSDPASLTNWGGNWNGDEEKWDDTALRRFMAMLSRRRRIVWATLLATVAVAIVFKGLASPVYRATATLQVHPAATNGAAVSSDLPVVSDLIGGIYQTRSIETQIEILKSDPVQGAAVLRLTPGAKKAVQEYSAHDIAPVGSTDLIAVSAQSHNPFAAAALANAICAEYIQLSLEKNRGQLDDAAKFVENQLRAVQQKLSRARADLEGFKKQVGVVDLQAQAQLFVNRLDAMEAEWKQARTEKTALQAQLAELQRMADTMAPTTTTPSGVVRRPAVESMKTQLTQLELDRMNKLQEFLPNSPEVRGIDGQIAAIRQQLKQEVQTEISGWQTQVNPVRQSVAQDIARLQGQIWATEARGVALKYLVKQARAEMARMPEQERRLSQLTTEVNNLQQTHQMLYTKLQSVNITRGARVANASVLFPAKTPRNPVGLSTSRTLAVVLLFGLLLAVGMAALVDRLDDRVFSEEDARVVSRLPVLAQIPLVDKQDELCLPLDTSEGISNGSPLLESFRMLRTMIAYSPTEKVTRSVVVTSSLPHEGKSLNSVNLAIAAAMSGESVILIDCDLRDPAIHRLLDLPNEVGFTTVTDGSISLLNALQETKVAGLRVLTSGPGVSNPFKLLKSGAARECLRQAMGQADFVVIDSPPALILADAQVLSTFADGTLMVISTQEASKREIARTRDLLVQTGARVIGAVLNKSTSDLGGYPGYYYNGPIPPTNQSLAQARKLLFER